MKPTLEWLKNPEFFSRVCHLQKNILKVEQRIYVICLTFFAEYDIIDV